MDALTVVFRTPSQSEADVVRGLLEAHGVNAMISSDISRTPFPMSVGQLQVMVSAEDAAHASRIIESHRDDSGATRATPFGAELEPLEQRLGYRFRDRG